jgi:hypothetical protein
VLLLSLESLQQVHVHEYGSFSTYGVGVGLKRIKPPKNYSYKYNFFAINFFGKVWTSHLGLFFLFLSIFD